MNLPAQRLDLLLDGRADVRHLDHRAQPLGGGDRLEARHPGPHHHHPRRLDGARGRHQQREVLGQSPGGEEHGLVAADRRLRGEGVHRLRPGDPGHQLEGEGGDVARAAACAPCRGCGGAPGSRSARRRGFNPSASWPGSPAKAPGGVTLSTTSALSHASRDRRPACAPAASNSASGNREASPAPCSTATSSPSLTIRLHGFRGGGDAGFPRTPLAWDEDLHHGP